MGIRIGDWDWGMRTKIRDWRMGLGLRIGITDWALSLGIQIWTWDWDLGIKKGDRNELL